ncbi:MAG: permease [Clostridia bacterium]
MIGIAVATKEEWKATLDILNIDEEELIEYPYGEYVITKIFNIEAVLYCSGYRKVMSAGAAQYIIDKFKIEKMIVMGTCAGINKQYQTLDILLPTIAVQYDCTIKEWEPLIKQRFVVMLEEKEENPIVIGTADRAVVARKDYKELQDNGITIADCESAAVAYICKLNNKKCSIIKGISDFPIEEEDSKKNEKQFAIYQANIPIIMKKIIEQYLEKEMQSK